MKLNAKLNHTPAPTIFGPTYDKTTLGCKTNDSSRQTGQNNTTRMIPFCSHLRNKIPSNTMFNVPSAHV